jgi:hypothetical protein
MRLKNPFLSDEEKILTEWYSKFILQVGEGKNYYDYNELG